MRIETATCRSSGSVVNEMKAAGPEERDRGRGGGKRLDKQTPPKKGPARSSGESGRDKQAPRLGWDTDERSGGSWGGSWCYNCTACGQPSGHRTIHRVGLRVGGRADTKVVGRATASDTGPSPPCGAGAPPPATHLMAQHPPSTQIPSGPQFIDQISR